jgi:hypothetical protein
MSPLMRRRFALSKTGESFNFWLAASDHVPVPCQGTPGDAARHTCDWKNWPIRSTIAEWPLDRRLEPNAISPRPLGLDDIVFSVPRLFALA